MIWVDILVSIILFFSFFGGLKEGAVRNFFSLIVFIIAIPLTGLSYQLIAAIFSFLPGTNWENFISFFITLGIIGVISQLVLLMPRKIIQKVWNRGTFFRFLGGILNVLNAGIGLVVLTLVIGAYPIIEWLERVVASSSVLARLVEQLSFVPAMLPEIFQNATVVVAAGLAV